MLPVIFYQFLHTLLFCHDMMYPFLFLLIPAYRMQCLIETVWLRPGALRLYPEAGRSLSGSPTCLPVEKCGASVRGTASTSFIIGGAATAPCASTYYPSSGCTLSTGKTATLIPSRGVNCYSDIQQRGERAVGTTQQRGEQQPAGWGPLLGTGYWADVLHVR